MFIACALFNPGKCKEVVNHFQVMKTEPVWPVKQERDDLILEATNDKSISSSTQNSSNSNNANSKPYTYLCQVAKNTDTVETVKGCMVSLASKLNTVEGVTGRTWQVKTH